MPYFICSNCGFGSASWIGKCPDCGEWNSLHERRDLSPDSKLKETELFEAVSLSHIKSVKRERLKSGIGEFDRVLGGGFVHGEVVLLTGEPGIGKSTLLLQSLHTMRALYISGEESAEQVKNRADRLGVSVRSFLFSNTLQVESIVEGIEKTKQPIDIVVIDSIQTVFSKSIDALAGNVAQLKGSTVKLIECAKKKKIPMVLIGHITKEGEVAGPKTLEHFVDCVCTFEGEKISHFRILRALKNRFGATDEIGIFEMKEQGLREVTNPTVFLDKNTEITAGKAIAGVTEGKRTLFFEIQTLMVPTYLAVPRRVVKGVDYNKVQILLAVLRKHLNLHLDKFDIYINVVGGVEIHSTGSDLAVVVSIYSSFTNILIPKKTVWCGEVGLMGEVRPVFFEDKIVQEAKRMHFSKIISSGSIKSIKELKTILTNA